MLHLDHNHNYKAPLIQKSAFKILLLEDWVIKCNHKQKLTILLGKEHANIAYYKFKTQYQSYISICNPRSLTPRKSGSERGD